jgi:hypothetical protein
MKPFHMQFLWTNVEHMVSSKSKRRSFDEAVKIEDKAFKSMLKSLPLHGGLPRNACYARIVDLKFVTFRYMVSRRQFDCFSG